MTNEPTPQAGGKPSKGTPKDKRLKENKPTVATAPTTPPSLNDGSVGLREW